jgi:hypothetical protein
MQDQNPREAKEGSTMNTYRKLRFPILIGAGVAAAGVLLYQTNSRIDSRVTQGAIGKREVYRDGQVSSADVKAMPGAAPVAIKVLLESKEFKAVAKNPAFTAVLKEPRFQALAQNANFLSAMANPSFSDLSNNLLFLQYMQSNAFADMAAGITLDMSQTAVQQAVQGSLVAANAQSLAQNPAFSNLFYNASFLFAMNQSLKQDLVFLLTFNSFHELVNNQVFANLMSMSEFQSALSSGMSSNLAAAVMQ